MKKILILFTILLPIILLGQSNRSGEIGLIGGGAFYLGELNQTPFVGTMPAGGLFYRHSFDTRLSIKGTGIAGLLGSEGQKIDGTPAEFSTFFIDGMATAEFNFIPYLPAHKKYTYSPYILLGIGVMYYPTIDPPIVLNIPFGAGFKYNINEQWVCGAEFTLKKTFVDNLDYDYLETSMNNLVKQQGYAGNKDWVSFFGIYIAHKIKYRMKCPAFD